MQECHGRGPAFTADACGFGSNAVIGARQADAARTILDGDLVTVRGSVCSVHVYVDMSRYEFALKNGTRVKTCPAAMGTCPCASVKISEEPELPFLGYSFAGGTTCVRLAR